MKTIQAKSILQKSAFQNNEWFGADYNMNLYRGCCHGCIYCDSRSDCYHIENFDEVCVKENAIQLLYQELKGKKKKGVVGIGAMSDSYNPFEKEQKVTREALKLIHKFGFGVSIDTKSALITRDIDLFQKISQRNPVVLKLTITTADDMLSKKIEPNVNVASKRFEAVKELNQNGIYTGILFTPILPFITDTKQNIKNIIELAYQNNAKFIVSMFGVTLRSNQRAYFYDKLDAQFPGLKTLYQSTYGEAYNCGIRDKSLIHFFQSECKKYGLLYEMNDIVSAYKKNYNAPQQLTL